MVVRLLPRQEVDKRKAEEQRQAIQEGLKVAERVDTLLETLASEEKAFEKYRIDSLKTIQEEIQAKRQEKEEIEATVIKLRSERAELMEPVTQHWQEIEAAEKQIEAKEAALYSLEHQLSQKASDLLHKERELENIEARAENLKQLAGAMFSQAEVKVAEAKEEAAEMRNKAQAELSLMEIRLVEVEKRETGVTIKGSQLEEKEQRIEKYEIDLFKREQVLREGWKQLERTKQKLNV